MAIITKEFRRNPVTKPDDEGQRKRTPSRPAPLQCRVLHSRGTVRLSRPVSAEGTDPPNQPSRFTERTLNGRLSGIHRKNH